MAEPVTVGIAGLGRSGWSMHAAALAKLPERYRVSAVMDVSEERCAEAQAWFGCETFGAFAELANAPAELLVVATPSQFHVEHTRHALEKGKHVLAEKPLARSLAEVDALIAAAKKADRVLSVNQNYRYHHDFRAIREVIASGKLGDIVQIRFAIHQFTRRNDWQTLRENNGGILSNHGAHIIDFLLQLFEDPDPEVFCHLVDTPLYAGDADSHAKIIIRPKDGPLLDIELTHCNAYAQDRFVVLGTQGSLTGSRRQLRWKYFIPEEEEKLEIDTQVTQERVYVREELSFVEESVQLTDKFNDDMVELYQDLYATLREGQPLQITPESVRRQIRIFDKCRASARW